MTKSIRRITGFATLLAIISGAAILSQWPAFRALPQGVAVVKLSFSHGGVRDCRQLSADELARLPLNMRRREVCDRARSPIYLELDLDGATVLAEALDPSGIASDGPSRVYRRFRVPAGAHSLEIRLREKADGTGFDYIALQEVTLRPAQNYVIDFRPEAGGFVFN